MEETETKRAENCYEFKVKKVLEDMKARPSVRAGKEWYLIEKISKAGREIVEEMVKVGEITKEYGRKIKPSDCRAPPLTGYPKVHKDGVPCEEYFLS